MQTLGLDIGTTSISAVVFEEGNGVLAARTLKNDSFLEGEAWERIQDPLKIQNTAIDLVSELLTAFPNIRAIGVTGQMHGILYLNCQGEPVSPLYIWQDGRGNLPCKENRSWAEYLSEITGYPLSTGYGLVTHAYNLQHGLVPETAAKLCTIHDYLAMVLAGNTTPATDPTDAASLGLYDLPQQQFDLAALKKVGIDPGILPQIPADPCLGSGDFGVPVFTAIGDNQASFLGATGGRKDILLVNMGTGGQISIFSSDYLETDTLETRPFPDGGWLLVGASLCGGRSYALLEAFFRETVKMVTGEECSAYDAMERMLEQSNTSADLPQVCTLFQGSRKEPGLRGAITGLTPENFTPLHLTLGLMQGMAEELYSMYEGFLAKGGKQPAAIIGSGNGLRRNKHLCRAFERVFGYPLSLSPYQEEAACGAAIYAAKHCI